jgi:hypothetical protein
MSTRTAMQTRAAVRKTLLTLAVVVVVTAGLVVAGQLPRYLDRARYAGTHNRAATWCANVPLAPAATPETMGDAMLWPYGAIDSCRALNGSAHLFGTVAVSSVLLLETEYGPVLVRVDYTNIDRGWQYVAVATELSPAQAGGLVPATDADRISAAIRTRGGLNPTPWTLHYGDG